MREIKFRGMDRKGIWHYGFLSFYDEDNIQYATLLDENGEHKCNNRSVGQFSGFADVCGTEIYEGDLVSLCDEYKGLSDPMEVRFYNGCFDVVDGTGKWIGLLWHQVPKLVVVGNIHENK